MLEAKLGLILVRDKATQRTFGGSTSPHLDLWSGTAIFRKARQGCGFVVMAVRTEVRVAL